MKNWTKVTVDLSGNFIKGSNDETSFPHKLSLTDTQVLKMANIKISKTQNFKIV